MPKKHKAVNPKSSENLLSKNKGSDISFESLNVHDQNAVLKKLELHAVEVYKERRKESNFLRKNLKKHSGSSPCAVPRLPGINKLNQKMTDYLNQILSTQDYEVDFSKVSRQGKKKSTPLASTTIREKKIGKPKLHDKKRGLTSKRERATSTLESEKGTASTIATQSVLVGNPATLFHVHPRSRREAASAALAKIETMKISGLF